MPWKESSLVDQRQAFVNEVLEGTRPFRCLCQEYGISRTTGYKWFGRYEEDGPWGLLDRSRRPHRSPGRLGERVVCDLIRFKLAHATWGPKKIRELYVKKHGDGPSLSSINRVLRQVGLVKKRRKRRGVAGGRLVSQIAIKEPNDVWTMDFKGWWYSRDHRRVEPFTVRDAFSRYVLASRVLPDGKTETIQQALKEVFKEYGLPRCMRSDNGSPFGSPSAVLGISRLSAWLISLGIQIHLIRPGHPQDNGGHERMHRDLKEEVQVRFMGNWEDYQAELDLWRTTFNTQRPHEQLDMKTPSEVYRKSSRPYHGTPQEMEYPKAYRTRAVNTNGAISLFNQRYYLTSALRGHRVGLKVLDATSLGVYYSQVHLGKIDLNTCAFQPTTTNENTAKETGAS